ncbi:TPA: hypothetical protein ACX6QP_002197 [Photobacterium damselae]
MSKQKLNPELIKYVEKGEFCTFIRHPLCISPYDSINLHRPSKANVFINELVESRQKRIKEFEAAKDYISAIQFVERPFRLGAAVKYLPHLCNKDYWALVYSLWEGGSLMYAEYIANEKEWLDVFNSRRGTNPTLKSEFFSSLDDEITIYRGSNIPGLNWCLSETLARAMSLSKGLYQITIGKASKYDVLNCNVNAPDSFITVVIDPANVRIIE